MDAPSPEQGPEILPRPRGIRAGKSAVRKRKAYQAYQLMLQPYRYRTAQEVPVILQDKTNRPLYSLPGWKPDFESDEGDEDLEEVIVEVEVDPLIPPSSGSAPSYPRLQRQPPPPPAPPVRPSSSSASSSVPKHLLKQDLLPQQQLRYLLEQDLLHQQLPRHPEQDFLRLQLQRLLLLPHQ